MYIKSNICVVAKYFIYFWRLYVSIAGGIKSKNVNMSSNK